jgi:hypothetical protein
MGKNIDLEFCNLVYPSDDQEIDYEKKVITEAYKINKDFAKIEIPKFEIKITSSRKEFEEIWGNKVPSYVSAFTKNDNIVIFSYEVFDKETKWEKEKFKEALVHEINHLFYQELRDDEYDPLWLSEGLATFMQHDKRKFNYKDKMEIQRNILEQSFEDMTLESYQVFTLFVEYLILNYGEEKIIKIIAGLESGKKLNILFQKIYNLSFEELIENGNEYHKTT